MPRLGIPSKPLSKILGWGKGMVCVRGFGLKGCYLAYGLVWFY